MVRLKTRYMLVRIEFADAMEGITSNGSKITKKIFPTRKDVARATQDSVLACFGTASCDASLEIQVRLCDATSGLVLMRVSRDNYSLVRASLTMLTSIPIQSDPSSFDGTRQPQQRLPVVTSVVSVHGSIRTAKRAMMERIRSYYRCRLEKLKRQNPSLGRKEIDRECRSMEDLLIKVQGQD